MRLDTLFVRFFRALNYDYLRKSRVDFSPDPWDAVDGASPYPFLRIKLEPTITAVVGSNEAGKSQLLDALHLALTSDEIEASDFCRYSPFFARRSSLMLPEVGVMFTDFNDEDRIALQAALKLEQPVAATALCCFRMNSTPKKRAYIRVNDEWESHDIKTPSALKTSGFPVPFRIDSDVPLPDSVPLSFLETGGLESGEQLSPTRARSLVATLLDKPRWFSSQTEIESSAANIASALVDKGAEITAAETKMFQLADDLLVKVCGISRATFKDLSDALSARKTAYAQGIVAQINEQLREGLNFPRWWSQDAEFELSVSLRDFELDLMIRDRTNSTYTFAERSNGLRYFLSYFVQYLAHEPPEDGQREVLLMDEPDAFLSASGQQDLLKVFSAFAEPESVNAVPVQVIYVTHSPFLLDKNHGERIRVLDKGEYDEGTRVVGNAAIHHYEPLRSSLGGSVGESVFIGSCNLVVEGISDQVILAGVTSLLRTAGRTAASIDLNDINIVPAGSASQVAYTTFLAVGRDVDKPAVIVLLDGDKAGRQAAKQLRTGGPGRKALLQERFILMLPDAVRLKDGDTAFDEIEDLFPWGIFREAVRRYSEEFLNASGAAASFDALAGPEAGTDRLAYVVKEGKGIVGDEDFHVDKLGLARALVSTLRERDSDDADRAQCLETFEVLLQRLSTMQRDAHRERSQDRIKSRLKRIARRSAADHPELMTGHAARAVLEEVEAQLDDTIEGDAVRSELLPLKREYCSDESVQATFSAVQFHERLAALAYAGERLVSSESGS